MINNIKKIKKPNIQNIIKKIFNQIKGINYNFNKNQKNKKEIKKQGLDLKNKKLFHKK